MSSSYKHIDNCSDERNPGLKAGVSFFRDLKITPRMSPGRSKRALSALFALCLSASLPAGGAGASGRTLQSISRGEDDLLRLAAAAFDTGFHQLSLNYLDQFSEKHPGGSGSDFALLLRGLSERKLERHDRAEAALTRLIAEHPGSRYRPRAFYLRAETNLARGLIRQAEADFEKALSLPLEEELVPSARLGLLTALADRGDFFASLAAWKAWRDSDRVRAESDENTRIIFATAIDAVSSALREGDLQAVIAIADLALSELPPNPLGEQVRYYLGAAYWNAGMSTLAAEIFRALTRSDDEEIALMSSFRLGDIMLGERRTEAAARHYQAAAGSSDGKIAAPALYQLGILARKRRDLRLAAHYFRKALAWEPGPELREKAAYEEASAYFLLGEYPTALNLYREFRRVFPKSSRFEEAWLQECFSLYNARDYPRALRHFEELIARGPAGELSGQAHYGLGLTLIATGRREQAFQAWKKFLDGQAFIGPHAAMALLLSRHYIESNNPDKAVPYLSRLSENPSIEKNTRAEAYLLLGVARLQGNRPGDAIADFRSGLALDPDMPTVVNPLRKNLADTLLADGRAAEALPIFEELVSEYPQRRGENLYGLAVSLERLQRLEEAVHAYLEALISLPADSPLEREIRDALSRLRQKQ